MRNTTKRTLALMLIVCMLLSTLPFAAFAVDPTYTFDFTVMSALEADTSTVTPENPYVPASYTPDTGKWKVLTSSGYNIKAGNQCLQVSLQDANNGKYLAVLLEDINPGVYTFNMVAAKEQGSPSNITSVFILPYTNWQASLPAGDALSDMTFRNSGKTLTDPIVDLNIYEGVEFSGDSGNDYVVLFQNSNNVDREKNSISLKAIKLTKTGDVTPGGDTPGGNTPGGSTPETPAPTYSWTAAQYFAATKALVEGSDSVKQIVAYSNKDNNFTTKYADPANGSYAGAGNEYLIWKLKTASAFVSFQYNTVSAGTYTVKIDTKACTGPDSFDVHIFSEADFAGCTNTSSKIDKTAELISAGAHKLTKITLAQGDTSFTFTATLSNAPIICIAEDDDDFTSINFTNVSFTASGDQETPDPIDPTNFAEVTVNGSTTKCTTEAEAVTAITSSASGATVKLMNNVNVGDNAALAAGVTLDLNGRALSGTIDTTQGTVIDSKDGKGSISAKPAKIADGKVALKDGSKYRIFSYSVKTVADAKANADKSGAFFWFQVSFSNKSAYALAAADADFSIGANLTVGDKSAAVKFDAALISAWAKANKTKYFVVCLEGLNSDAIAAGTVLTLTPMVNDSNSTSISYTK